MNVITTTLNINAGGYLKSSLNTLETLLMNLPSILRFSTLKIFMQFKYKFKK